MKGDHLAEDRESIGTGPTLGLLTTGGTPALCKPCSRCHSLPTASSIPYENAPVVDSLLDAGMISMFRFADTELMI
jgi:hypothetical protein